MNEDTQLSTGGSDDLSRRSSRASSPDSDVVLDHATCLDSFDFVETVNTKLKNIENIEPQNVQEEKSIEQPPKPPAKPFRNGLDMFAEEGSEFDSNYQVLTRFSFVSPVLKLLG